MLTIMRTFIILSVNLLLIKAIASQHQNTNNKLQNNGGETIENSIITLPLITHKALKLRRLREWGLSLKDYEEELSLITPSQRKKRRRLASSTVEVGGLYQGYGTHYVDVWVGTPPQRQTLIVDTGSGVTAFPCSGCSKCGSKYHASAFFTEADSQTFEKSTCSNCISKASCSARKTKNEYCKLGVSYQEGSSWTAYQARDLTYLGGPHDVALKEDADSEDINRNGMDNGENPMDANQFRFSMTFGCQTRIDGLFITQLADGIMGMSLQKSALWRQMYGHNIISSPSFSMCFSREPESSKEGTIAGALTMGGTDTKLHKTSMVYAEGHPYSGDMHGVSIRNVYFMEAGQYKASNATSRNTHKFNVASSLLNTGKVIVDSGTTDTYLTNHVAKEFERLFKQLVGKKYDIRGISLTKKEVSQIPSIIIQLYGSEDQGKGHKVNFLDKSHPNDVLIVIPPSHYFEYSPSKDLYEPRVFADERYGSVLGANFMAGHDVFFDIPENKRIGFAESNCDYPKLINFTKSGYVVSSPTRIAGNVYDYDNLGAGGGPLEIPEKKCYSFVCMYYKTLGIGFVCLLLLMRGGWKWYKRNTIENLYAEELAALHDSFDDNPSCDEEDDEDDDGNGNGNSEVEMKVVRSSSSTGKERNKEDVIMV